VLGERELFAEVRPALEDLAGAARAERGPRPLGPFQAYFKGSPLATRPALRHAVRRVAGLEIPRLQEFSNLEWLRARGFLAARPLLAGVRSRAVLPRYQFLFTELRPAESTLGQWFPLAPPAERARRLAALARDVARMHGLGFVHRDLYPRNLLVPTDGADPRCAFLDAWRSGPGRGLRARPRLPAPRRRQPLHTRGAVRLPAQLPGGEPAPRPGLATELAREGREGPLERPAARGPAPAGDRSGLEIPGQRVKPSPPPAD
jgi:hypothetical protein